MAEHHAWFPVGAPEIGGRISNGDDALNADDWREVALSYDTTYRAAKLICGYDAVGGDSGPSHFVGSFLPKVTDIRALRFVEESQELEAEMEVTERLRQLFDMGFDTPSVGLFKFPDHPDGEPRLYCQHIGLTGPGEVEIIAGLGGERWEERLRSFNADLTEIGESLRRYKFRALTPEEMKMADDPKAETTKKAAHEDDDEEKTSSKDQKKRSAAPDVPAPVGEAPVLRAVETDPTKELQAQIAEQGAQIGALSKTVATFVEGAGDPARVRAAAGEVETILEDMKTRAARDQEAHIRREVEALAAGPEPRITVAETDFVIRALLRATPAEAATELETFRARDPIATDLETPHREDLFEGLPENFSFGTYQNAGGGPSASQIRAYAKLSAEGEGTAAQTVIARERAANMRRYHG